LAEALQRTDQEWMHEAIKLAKHATSQQEVPVGAILVREDKLIGEGWNQPISKNDPSAHAEIIALRDAAANVKNYRLLHTTMYVTLEPCLMCVGAMLHARIERLVFGAHDPKTGAVETVFKLLENEQHNHQIHAVGGVLGSECGALLKDFFSQRR